jgi:FkbM family methyltransferase
MNRLVIKVVKPLVERFPKLATMYRLISASWYLTDEPQTTPLGFKFIGNRAMQRGEFEVEETALVRALLPTMDVFVNVGANIGYYCCIAASMGKKVVACEPIALNLQYLIKNVEANHWSDRIEIFPVALNNRSGAVRIYGNGTGASLLMGWSSPHKQYPTMVAAATLDEVLGSRFPGKRCLILIDIEGSEKAMLDGALAMLNRQPKPIWMVEITSVEHQPKGVIINPHFAATFQMFWDRGYEAWTATRPSRRIFPADVERIVRREQYALPTHNFLFIEEGQDIWPKPVS